MSVASTTATVTTAGNGVRIGFDFAFKIFAASDIVVTNIDSLGVETTLLLGSDYTLAFDSDAETGTVTLVVATASGASNRIARNTALTQASPLPREGTMPSKTIENMVDKLTLMVQDLSARLTAATVVAGAGIRYTEGTFSAVDAAMTTLPYIAKITDQRLLMYFTGDRSLGTNGWVSVTGY